MTNSQNKCIEYFDKLCRAMYGVGHIAHGRFGQEFVESKARLLKLQCLFICQSLLLPQISNLVLY